MLLARNIHVILGQTGSLTRIRLPLYSYILGSQLVMVPPNHFDLCGNVSYQYCHLQAVNWRIALLVARWISGALTVTSLALQAYSEHLSTLTVCMLLVTPTKGQILSYGSQFPPYSCRDTQPKGFINFTLTSTAFQNLDLRDILHCWDALSARIG